MWQNSLSGLLQSNLYMQKYTSDTNYMFKVPFYGTTFTIIFK